MLPIYIVSLRGNDLFRIKKNPEYTRNCILTQTSTPLTEDSYVQFANSIKFAFAFKKLHASLETVPESNNCIPYVLNSFCATRVYIPRSTNRYESQTRFFYMCSKTTNVEGIGTGYRKVKYILKSHSPEDNRRPSFDSRTRRSKSWASVPYRSPSSARCGGC